ncbi:MAG: NosD domain-containing protein [Candidatus Hodarchaeales archaeon]|jgi:M6 family metalloprotease-like protein
MKSIWKSITLMLVVLTIVSNFHYSEKLLVISRKEFDPVPSLEREPTSSVSSTYREKSKNQNRESIPSIEDKHDIDEKFKDKVSPRIANPSMVARNVRIAVVLGEFTSLSHISTHNASFYENILQKVNEYYGNVSREAVSISATIFDNNGNWFPLGLNSSYWVDDDFNETLLAENVLNNPSIDFSAFETVVIVHSGTNLQEKNDSKNPLTSYRSLYDIATNLRKPFIAWDGTELNGTIFIPDQGQNLIGTIAHEIGHHLGLQDLYDNEFVKMFPLEDQVFCYDLMAHGSKLIPPTWISSYSQQLLGWVDYEVLEKKTTEVIISPLESLLIGDSVYTIPVNNSCYYLLEVRNKSINYWDSSTYPNFREGVIIYFIDTDKLMGDVIYDTTYEDDPYIHVLDSDLNDGLGGSPFGLSDNNNSYFDDYTGLNITIIDQFSNGSYLVTISFSHVLFNAIEIDGNAHFKDVAEDEGWIGDGSPTNPYIIDWLHFDGITLNQELKISNTTLHIQIQNCLFSDCQIFLMNSSNVIIQGNQFVGDVEYGMVNGDYVSNITIQGNLLECTDSSGIVIAHSRTSLSSCVIHNNIVNNPLVGIYMYWCANFTISSNTISNGKYEGLWIESSCDSLIDNNTINGCENGMWFYNRVIVQGILTHTSNHTITNNKLLNNTVAIKMQESDNNTINNNLVMKNDQGVILEYSLRNNISQNTFAYNNKSGLILHDCISNPVDFWKSLCNVTWNNFIGNHGGESQSVFSSSIVWFEFNFWDGWTYPDNDSDGFVDDPYYVTTYTTDRNPLITPYKLPQNLDLVYGLRILNPIGGEQYNNSLKIEWTNCTDTFGHSFDYKVEYSNDSGLNWNSIAAELETTSFDWDTSTVSDGDSYLIRINVSCHEGVWEIYELKNHFSILNHFLTPFSVVYPNGGEILSSLITIDWSPCSDSESHDLSYSVSYSTDGGNAWIHLDSGITGISYEWDTTDIIDNTNCLVRVNASCTEGLWLHDHSDNIFSIDNSIATTSTIPITTSVITTIIPTTISTTKTTTTSPLSSSSSSSTSLLTSSLPSAQTTTITIISCISIIFYVLIKRRE